MIEHSLPHAMQVSCDSYLGIKERDPHIMLCIAQSPSIVRHYTSQPLAPNPTSIANGHSHWRQTQPLLRSNRAGVWRLS